MKTHSNRVRTVVVAILAALAMAVSPAVAAQAVGPGSATLTFTGAPLPGIELFYFHGSDGEYSFGLIEDGVAVLTDLALDTYEGNLQATPTSQEVSFSFSLTADQPHFEGEIALQAWPSGSSSISGVVTGAGAPLEGAQLSLTAFSGQPLSDVFTAADGRYGFTELPAGEYELLVLADGFFSQTLPLQLADGEMSALDVTLVPRDAAITGRVVDSDGAGVEGVVVAAFNDPEAGMGESDADGYYTITELGQGDWVVSIGGPDFPWQYTSTVVSVEAASTATAPDLVAVPRTTGSISGLALAADVPADEDSGLANVCVDVITPAGAPVEGASAVTEFAGNFYIDAIAPGEYTIAFSDCDDTRSPRYLTGYLGDVSELSDASTFTIAATDNLYVGNTYLTPENAAPQPENDPEAPVARDLTSATRDLIHAPNIVAVGQKFEVFLGEQYAGQWVSVWFRTPTTQLGGWRLVASDGSLHVPSPDRYPPAEHRLVVQTADDTVIGWTTVKVARPNERGSA